jgi:isoleucyl-tRNA synthetase
LLQLVKDEVNVKEITFDDLMENDVVLDTRITPELKAEGQAREFVRAVQDIRKEKGFSQNDEITLTAETNNIGKEIINTHLVYIKKTLRAREILFNAVSDGTKIVIDNVVFQVSVSV